MRQLLKHRHQAWHKAGRLLTSPWRGGPDVLILGAMKSGTTSLHRYLEARPGFVGPFNKEVHYFDWRWRFGRGWYRAYFPTRRTLRRKAAAGQPRALTGEASPYYLFHPLAAERIHWQYPDARLIAMLRDPVERAVSHYRHEAAHGWERLSLEDALAAEPERIARPAGVSVDQHYAADTAAHHYSYLARGRYAEQLARFYEHFPRHQIRVLQFETFFADPANEFARVLEFLDLPTAPAPAGFERFNPARAEAAITDDLRQQLRAHFAPHNRALRERVGEHIDWGY